MREIKRSAIIMGFTVIITYICHLLDLHPFKCLHIFKYIFLFLCSCSYLLPCWEVQGDDYPEGWSVRGHRGALPGQPSAARPVERQRRGPAQGEEDQDRDDQEHDLFDLGQGPEVRHWRLQAPSGEQRWQGRMPRQGPCTRWVILLFFTI